MILRYKWNGNFTAEEISDQIPAGFTATIQEIGPWVFVDLEVLPAPNPVARTDLDEFMASLGWSFVATDPTTPTSSLNCSVSVYDLLGGQTFTGTVPILFDTVKKNMSTSLYTFDSVAGTIEVLEAAIYEVSFDVSLNTSSAQEITSRSYLTRNGVFEAGTNAYSYHRISNGRATCSMTSVMDLIANDVLGVNARRAGTSGTLVTVAEGSRLTLRCVG